jgi:hypothetical protein
MPCLSKCLDHEGVNELMAFINDEPELAFIVSTGPGRWRAVNRVPELPDGEYVLWHDPGGPLMLLRPNGGEQVIKNPWKGWTEQVPGADSGLPYFGPMCTNVFQLEVRREGIVPGAGGITSINWIGNRYAPIGRGAADSTRKCWHRLKRWFDKKQRGK